MTAVWEFDGADGRSEILQALVGKHIEALSGLVPENFEDPVEQLAAEFRGEAGAVIDANPVLARLFPPALSDSEQAAMFRRDALGQQARMRLDAASVVWEDVADHEDRAVPVPLDHVDAWVMTLAGLRAQWNVELTGSGDRLAEATFRDTMRNPTAAAVTDWLGYLIEDALETRATWSGEE